MPSRSYIAIDQKSFYASAECADRKLDPLTTNLVVADQSRTDKTICLAVSPALKACGIPGRPRLVPVGKRDGLQHLRDDPENRLRVLPPPAGDGDAQRAFCRRTAGITKSPGGI